MNKKQTLKGKQTLKEQKLLAKKSKAKKHWHYKGPETGIIYTMKKMGRFDLLEILSKNETSKKVQHLEDMTPDVIKALKEFTIAIVMNSVYEPKITIEETESSLTILDIEDDLDGLMNAVLSKVKLDRRSMERMGFFRPVPLGKGNRPHGSKDPKTPDGNNGPGDIQNTPERQAPKSGHPSVTS